MSLITTSVYSQINMHIVNEEDQPAAQELEKKYNVTHKAKDPKVMPDKHSRDAFLEGSGIPQDWDELDRDIFYMDLKTKSFAEVKNKYPKIDPKTIQELQVKHKK